MSLQLSENHNIHFQICEGQEKIKTYEGPIPLCIALIQCSEVSVNYSADKD